MGVKRGIKVTLVTPDFVIQGEGKEVPKFEKISGVEHMTVQTQRTPVYRKNLCMAMSLANLAALVSLIRRVRPDIVHGTQEASMQVLATACILCDVPLMISMHTDVAQIAVADHTFSFIGGAVG